MKDVDRRFADAVVCRLGMALGIACLLAPWVLGVMLFGGFEAGVWCVAWLGIVATFTFLVFPELALVVVPFAVAAQHGSWAMGLLVGVATYLCVSIRAYERHKAEHVSAAASPAVALPTRV